MSGPDYLDRAEAVANRYDTAEVISDEAELLRGCLFALVFIAQQLDPATEGSDAGL